MTPQERLDYYDGLRGEFYAMWAERGRPHPDDELMLSLLAGERFH